MARVKSSRVRSVSDRNVVRIIRGDSVHEGGRGAHVRHGVVVPAVGTENVVDPAAERVREKIEAPETKSLDSLIVTQCEPMRDCKALG